MILDHFSVIILWSFLLTGVWPLLTFKGYKRFDLKIKHACLYAFAIEDSLLLRNELF